MNSDIVIRIVDQTSTAVPPNGAVGTLVIKASLSAGAEQTLIKVSDTLRSYQIQLARGGVNTQDLESLIKEVDRLVYTNYERSE